MSRVEHYLFKANCRLDKLEEYIKKHNNIPKEVSSGLTKAGVNNLQIFAGNTTIGEIFMHVAFESEGIHTLDDAIGPGSKYRDDPVVQEWEFEMATSFHDGWQLLPSIHDSDNWPK